MYVKPANEMQARFSMAYCVAAAAHDKDLTLATFRRASIGRADIAAFIPRVTMASDPAQPADMPSTMKSWATTIITTTQGQRITTKVVDPKGYPDNPLSEQELADKFRDCAASQPGPVASSYADWRRVASAPKMRSLCARLRSVTAANADS